MEDTIVGEWLKSLHLEEHTESFIDNGYDDLEICKQISAPDLDAIGVVDGRQRGVLLDAVQRLREEGAASVYFTVEEAQAARGSDRVTLSTRRRWRGSGSCGGSAASTPGEASKHILGNSEPGVSRSSSCSSVDAYEAGRAELVRLPHSQLHTMLAHLLERDNVNLTVPPYTDKDGCRGVLEGLASRYADQFTTHYQDVLDLLDQLRTRALLSVVKPPVIDSTSVASVSSASSSVAIAGSSTAMPTAVEDGAMGSMAPSAAPGANGLSVDDVAASASVSVGGGGSVKTGMTAVAPSVSTGQLSSISSSPEPGMGGHGGRYLPTHYASTDQAIYVPGKYNPSSCLSDAEEDEIYGYTGGDGGGRPTPPPRNNPAAQGYLNPRSQFIYELPPLGGRAGGKRRLGLGRLIKTLRRDLKRAAPSRLKAPHHTTSRSGVGGGPVGCGRVMACGVAGAAGVTSDESGNGIIVATSAGGAEGAVADTSTDHTPLMVLPGYYYNQQQHHLQQHHHQQQQSSSSSSTTLPQHQHQHSNTTNTTTLTATDSSTSNSSSPRGSQHSSRSSGAHSAATAQSSAPLNPHFWSGGLQPGGGGQQGWPPPHTAPVTPASTTPRDSGLQQAIERLKEQEVLRRRQDQFLEHEQMLRDLREGLLRRGAGGGDLHPSHRSGETAVFYTSHPSHGVGSYMYADQVGVGRAMVGEGVGEGVSGDEPPSPTPPGLPHHWYDEPPYESDPEDFLVGSTDLNSGELGARSLRDSLREEDVISLRTAGDISLPRSSDPLLQNGSPASACQQLQQSAAAVAAYYNYHHSNKRPLPCNDPHLTSDPYRDHRDLFGDTYREPWAGGVVRPSGKDGNSSDRDPSRGKTKRDKDKGGKENKDKYGQGRAREQQHTSRKTLSKDLASDPEYTYPSKNAIFGSYSLDHDDVGAAGTLPPHLLSRLTAATSGHHHPVYDNISSSGSMGQPGYMMATGAGTTNGLHHHATANGLSSSAATTPTGGGHPFMVDHNWRHHLHHQHQMTAQGAGGTLGGLKSTAAYQQPVRQQRHHHAQYHQYYHPHHHTNDGSGGGTLANGMDPSFHQQTQASAAAGPPPPARHNLQLRGLTSQQHYLHMQARQHNHHQQQYPNVGDVGAASTSPDYNLRWDLHNITVASGPSRLSALSVDSQRSDPSDLRLSNLMVSGDVAASMRCDGSCEARAKAGVGNVSGGGAGLYPSSPHTHVVPSVTAPPPPSGYVCCGSNGGCGAASTCCCCLSVVAAAQTDPIVGLTHNLSDQLTLGELRRSQQLVRQSLPPRPGCMAPASASQGRLMVQSRPQSLLPSVCSTTDCHLDGGRRLCPAVAAQSLADLSNLQGPVPEACCGGAALVPLAMPLRLAASASRGVTATVASAGSVITAAAVTPSLNSCGGGSPGVSLSKPQQVKGDGHLVSQLTTSNRSDSDALSQTSGKSCSTPHCAVLVNPLNDAVSGSPKHGQRVCASSKVAATSEPTVESANSISYNDGSVKAAVGDSVRRSPLASASPSSARAVMPPSPSGSVVKSPSSSSIVSLSAALQKTPAHLV